jgi:hypothetical protein
MPEMRYQRLTRAHARSMFSVAFTSRSSLWLGDDHLLCVDSSGFSETYKRFYFRDIQGIVISETNRRTIWNAVLILPAVFALAGLMMNAFQPRQNIGATIAWSIVAAIFLVPFVINNILGATCACQLRTAVQIEELPSLSRVRQARKVLEKIRPFVTAAQGQLTAEEVSARMRESTQQTPDATAQSPAAETSGVPPILS